MNNLKHLSRRLQFLKHRTSFDILPIHKIPSETPLVPLNLERSSWVHTAIDFICCSPDSNEGKSTNPPTSAIYVPNQSAPIERRLGKLIAEHIKRKELFYGIELAAHSFRIPLILDYNKFGDHLPLFTAVIWLGQEYGPIERLTDIDMVRFAVQLQPYAVVLPHLACKSVDHLRLKEFLALNFKNIFVIRGFKQQVEQCQDFPETSDLVREIRKLKQDAISIGVGGYPEGHMKESTSKENMEKLKQKVDAGADYIMTKICFSSATVINYVKNCREHDINVPIVVGVYIPENIRSLRFISEFAHAKVSPADIAQYATNADNPKLFREYAIRQTVHLITDILQSNLDIYGFQFFTMNNFDPVYDVVKEVNAIHDGKNTSSKEK